MTTLKATKGKETRRFTVPGSADEITLGQFVKMLTGKDELDRLSAITGLNREWLGGVEDDSLLDVVYSRLLWLDPKALIADMESAPAPDWVADIESYTLGQKIEAKQLLQRMRDQPKIAVFPELIRIYGKKDGYSMPLREGYSAGNFFLAVAFGLPKNGRWLYGQITRLKRSRQGLSGSNVLAI